MLKRATYAVVASAATELAANLSVRGQHRARARKLRGPSPPQLEAALSDVNQLLSGERPPTTPIEVLAVYCWVHEQLYGCLPIELIGETKSVRTTRMAALARIRYVATRHFNGSFVPFIDFLAWSAGRERARQQRKPGEEWRVGWRLQFSDGFLTDWQVARKKGRRG